MFFPQEIHKIINNLSPKHYPPPVGFMEIISIGEKDCTFIARFLNTMGLAIEKTILDCHSQYSVHNLGFKNEAVSRIKQKVVNFILSPYFISCGREKNSPHFAHMLVEAHKAMDMDQFLPKTSGTEVIDSVIKLIWRYWFKTHPGAGLQPKIVSFSNNFHGRSLGALSLSSNTHARDGLVPFLTSALFINDIPFGDRDALQTLFNKYKWEIAGVIAEPVQGEGGVYVPPDGYLMDVERLCRENGALFVLDEIQTGMGRVGGRERNHLFAYQDQALSPDLVCSGKAIGGGFLPLSMLAGKKEVMGILEPSDDGATFSGYTLGNIAFCATIEELIAGRYVQRSQYMGEFLRELLKTELRNFFGSCVKEVRGKGLFVGLELNPDFCTGREFSYALLCEGIWSKETGSHGQTMRIAPPLTIEAEQIITCVDAVVRAIKKVQKNRTEITNALHAQAKLSV